MSKAVEDFHRLYYMIADKTLLSGERLYGLFKAIVAVEKEGIPGEVMECGAAAGGSAALMGLTLKSLGSDRLLWVLDTFEGIPAPTADDPAGAEQYTGAFKGSLEDVGNLFNELGIKGLMLKGMFQDTLSAIKVGHLAVLHLDGDWYESTKCCLENLYDRVSPGGFIQIDDYGHWEGCRKAVNEFFESRGLSPELEWLDYTGVQFRKEK